VEKHFTDDTTRVGPDHGFSLDPISWRAMVDDTRILEAALGNGRKAVEPNEEQTVVLQRRCVRVAHAIAAGAVLTRSDLEVLRPAPVEAVPAHELNLVINRKVARDLAAGEEIRWSDLT